MLCMPGFSGGQMEDYPCVGQHVSQEEKCPKAISHLTCEQRCQIYALSFKAATSQASSIARQIGVDPVPDDQPRALFATPAQRGYRFKQAREGGLRRERQRGLGQAAQNKRQILVELIEEKLDANSSGVPMGTRTSMWRRMASPLSVNERIYQHVWKDKKDGGTLSVHLRHSGKKIQTGARSKNSEARADFRTASI